METFLTQNLHSRDFVASSLGSKYTDFYPKISLREINKVKENKVNMSWGELVCIELTKLFCGFSVKP